MRFVANPIGDGLLVRTRTISFALLGLTTAVGLGLVAFVSQLGWPNILGGPLPGLPAEAGAVHSKAIAPQNLAVPNRGLTLGFGSKALVSASPKAPAALKAPELSGSSKVLAPSSPSHGGQSDGQGVPGAPSGSQPPATTPASVPAPGSVPSTSSPPSAVASPPDSPKSHGKGSGKGKALGHSEDGGNSKGESPSAPKAKAYTPAPPAPTPTADPSSSTYPGKDKSSLPSGETGDGHGRGHAYGHYGK